MCWLEEGDKNGLEGESLPPKALKKPHIDWDPAKTITNAIGAFIFVDVWSYTLAQYTG